MEASLNKKDSEPLEIKVEVGACSPPSKAEEILKAFKHELSRLKEKEIEKWSVVNIGCRGLCFKTPYLSNNDKGAIKAFMLGGVGSGFLPKELLNIPLSHSDLESIGTRVGSGKILIIDHNHDIIDMTRYAVQRMIDESCERCQPCVRTLESILNLLSKIMEGHAMLEDLSLLKQVAENLRENALCEFGRLAPTIILSGLKYFEEDYRNHIVE